MYRLCLFFCLLGLSSFSNAATCVSVASGDWTSSANWECDGIPGVPAAGDNVIIMPSHQIIVSTTFTISGGPVYLYIYGNLHFGNGAKMTLPAGSGISATGGTGTITGSGGGNSNRITIGTTNVWNVGSGPVEPGETLGTPPPPSPLPVDLISFSGESLKGKGVSLSWITASEINNDQFIIERSTDGRSFQTAGSVKGRGFSASTVRYEFNDNEGPASVLYYRLRQQDYDGKEQFSDIIAIDNRMEEASPSLYPNPATTTGTVNIQWTAFSSLSSSILITDMSGRTVYSTQTTQSGNSIDLSTLGLSSGRYLVRCISGENTKNIPLIISR